MVPHPVAVVLVVGAIATFLLGAPGRAAFLFQTDASMAARWWTLWTAHGVHFSASHLCWDGGAILLLGTAAGRSLGSAKTVALLLLAAPLITLGVIVFDPDLAGYGGYSGLACALAGAWIVNQVQRGGHRRMEACWLAAVLVAKIAWELAHPGGALFAGMEAETARPVASAHAIGALAGGGLVCFMENIDLRFSIFPSRVRSWCAGGSSD